MCPQCRLGVCPSLLALPTGSRGMRSRRMVSLLVLSCLISVISLAHASAPDPTWLEGIYDNADGDEIIVFLTGAAGIVAPTPSVTRPPLLVAASSAPPDAARVASADMRRRPPGRAPPRS